MTSENFIRWVSYASQRNIKELIKHYKKYDIIVFEDIYYFLDKKEDYKLFEELVMNLKGNNSVIILTIDPNRIKSKLRFFRKIFANAVTADLALPDEELKKKYLIHQYQIKADKRL